MTSTIKPFEGMPHNQRSDPLVRLEDYKLALSQYLKLPDGQPDEILFVDNSGYSLSGLEQLRNDAANTPRTLRFLSVVPVLADCKSKPYGELDIQDQAYRRILSKEDPETVVWKVTGRLFVPNIQELMKTYPLGSSLYCDLRSVPFIGNRLGGNPWFDMRIWAHTSNFYGDHLLDLKERIPLIDEGAFFRFVFSLLKNKTGIVPRFKIQPQFSGHCAANNSDYSAENLNIKNRLRRFSRRWMPSLWI